MVKSPVVYTAGLLRMRGDRVETGDWVYLDAMAGQQLFYPPNVSGWDETRWLDTSTFRARWLIARRALQKHAVNPATPRRASGRRPTPTDARRPGARLVELAPGLAAHAERAPRLRTRRRWPPRSPTTDRQKTFPLMTYNALRHLVAVSPEMQTA